MQNLSNKITYKLFTIGLLVAIFAIAPFAFMGCVFTLSASYTLPVMRIYTNSGEDIVNRDIWLEGSISLENGEEEFNFDTRDVRVRGRGNSTWWHGRQIGKPPLRIRFPQAVSMFGLPADRDWALLSNPFDHTMLRNYLALDLAQSIARNDAFHPNTVFLELYVNGRYQGVYVLHEQNRVQTQPGVNNADFFMELDYLSQHEGDNDWFFAPVGNPNSQNAIRVRAPEVTSADLEYLTNFMTHFNNVLRAPGEEYLDYIDLESWVDFFLVQEIFMNPEIAWKSVFFYKLDGRIFMGPVWDFDWTSNNLNSVGRQNENSFMMSANGWIASLLEKESFREALAIRWEEIRPQVDDMLDKNDEIQSRLSVAVAHENRLMQKRYRFFSFERNRVIRNGTWQQEVNALFEFLNRRAVFLDGHFASWLAHN